MILINSNIIDALGYVTMESVELNDIILTLNRLNFQDSLL